MFATCRIQDTAVRGQQQLSEHEIKYAEDISSVFLPTLARLTRYTTLNMTGTSIHTPTAAANAAPDSKPNRLIAAATANSKKFDATTYTDGSTKPARDRKVPKPHQKIKLEAENIPCGLPCI